MKKLKLFDEKFISMEVSQARSLGANILSGKRPKISCESDDFAIEIEKKYDENNIDYLVDDNEIWQHVDIWGAPFSLTYDMGKTVAIDKVCISGYAIWHAGNYMLHNFELYASENEEDLYAPENMVAKYYREKDVSIGEGAIPSRNVIFSAEGEARFFGVKILEACHSDEIARISRIALFSAENTATYMMPESLKVADTFKGLIPSVEGEVEGNLEDLTNGRALLDEEAVEVKEDSKLIFKNILSAKEIYIVGKDVEIGKLVANGEEIAFEVEKTDSFKSRQITKLIFSEQNNVDFCIEIKKGASLDLIFGNTELRKASVKTKEVIDNDYIGAGCNVFPNAFSDYAKREGYNEVYWELEKHHIMKAKPHCIRMWFQIDWVVDTLEQYVSGDWQFQNPEMQSAVKYCEIFREAGVEVELDFGWKVGSKVQDWFSIGGVAPEQKHCAAPSDLYNYGKAAVATLEYLILEKGCDNVKYITFYNEVSPHPDSSRHYDYAMHGDGLAYWAAMAKYTKAFLDRSPLKGQVEIWAAEECSGHEKVMDRMNILIPDAFARHTVHKYALTYDEVCKWGEEIFKPHNGGKPVILTEFGNSYRTTASYDMNTVCNLLSGANHGISGAFIWVMAGSPLVDPLNWMHAGKDSDNSYQHWTFFPIAETLEDCGESFYELCLLNHYLPKHCKALKSEFYGDFKDVRINAFSKEGEYTVVVESKGDNRNNVRIELDKHIGKTFYRHTYKRRQKGEGNLIIHPVDKVMEIDNVIEDTLSLDYSLVVYTTMKPVTQVIMDKVDIKAKAGEKIKVGASLLDAPAEMEIKYSISKSLCSGATLENGVVSIPETAKAGDMLAVKAEVSSGEYGISIIRIV